MLPQTDIPVVYWLSITAVLWCPTVKQTSAAEAE